MAKIKEPVEAENFLDRIARKNEAIKSLPLIATRAWVTEKSPDYDDGYGYDIKGTVRQVSPYFDSREVEDVDQAVQDWLDSHEPDSEYHKFSVHKQYLRTITEDRWGWI